MTSIRDVQADPSEVVPTHGLSGGLCGGGTSKNGTVASDISVDEVWRVDESKDNSELESTTYDDGETKGVS